MTSRRILKKQVFLILMLGFMICASIVYAQKDSNIAPETVIQHRTIELSKKKVVFTKQEINMIKSAKDVVKKYWISSYEDIYGLFSEGHKDMLKRTQKISNAIEFKNSIPITERVWLKQTYQRAEVQGNSFIQIIVLAGWEEEGYEGVMTFIFDMVRENGSWKIENIKF